MIKGKEIGLIRAPKRIMHGPTGTLLSLKGLELGENPLAIYEDDEGAEILLLPSLIEKEYYYDRPQPHEDLITQGKYDCAAAALAMLLGHTLFQVKSVMGEHGWRNDDKGAGDKISRATARSFGRDLVWCGRKSLARLLHLVPDGMVCVKSLNYKGMGHGVTWLNGQIIDPNYMIKERKSWGPQWAPWTMAANGVHVLAKEPLSDKFFKEFREIRIGGTEQELCEAIMHIKA